MDTPGNSVNWRLLLEPHYTEFSVKLDTDVSVLTVVTVNNPFTSIKDARQVSTIGV